ncbi:methyltransferase domain-containing protein [Candidatus Bathyarchaeota archaeon]|nr:methyltransferase domain-containing protein [Candidatus Bathyarchaeota archaeon]
MKLNAGCGCSKWGDIRVDIEKYSSLYGRVTTSNIVASIEFLPFRDKVFAEVRCYHVLEHVDNPFNALKELLRIGEKVDVHVPTHNFYCIYLYGLIIIPVSILWCIKARSFTPFLNHIRGVQGWRKRASAHKWYVKLHGATLKKWGYLPIPLEYQKIYG